MRTVLLLVIVLIVGAQFVPVTRDNPPVAADFDGDAAVKAVLKESCYNCHSNETVWTAPQSFVAPASWWVARDVSDGRQELNFSRWASYDARRLARKGKEIQAQVSHGSMPPLLYRLAHPEAKLSDADRAALITWAGGLQTAPVTPSQK